MTPTRLEERYSAIIENGFLKVSFSYHTPRESIIFERTTPVPAGDADDLEKKYLQKFVDRIKSLNFDVELH